MAYNTFTNGTSATVNASDLITNTYNPITTTFLDDYLSTTTTTTTTDPSAITITPSMVTSTYYTTMPSTVNVTVIGEEEIEKKIKKARDDIDKHVDELEQDLEYQNEQRQELEQTVLDMGDRIAAQDELIEDLQTKLEYAATQIRMLREQQQEFLNNNFLARICNLEDKIYEMDQRDVGQNK